MKKLYCLLLVLLMSALSTNACHAQGGLGLGLGYLYGRGFGYGYGYNDVTHNYTPPYFSIHPPVYYGKRYSRPYGASPFAAWPQLQPNSTYAPEPHTDRAQIIANPHIPCVGDCTCGNCMATIPAAQQQQVGLGLVTQRPVAPLVIENPYYQPAIQYTSKIGESDEVRQTNGSN